MPSVLYSCQKLQVDKNLVKLAMIRNKVKVIDGLPAMPSVRLEVTPFSDKHVAMMRSRLPLAIGDDSE